MRRGDSRRQAELAALAAESGGAAEASSGAPVRQSWRLLAFPPPALRLVPFLTDELRWRCAVRDEDLLLTLLGDLRRVRSLSTRRLKKLKKLLCGKANG